jgi:hypothetical protein
MASMTEPELINTYILFSHHSLLENLCIGLQLTTTINSMGAWLSVIILSTLFGCLESDYALPSLAEQQQHTASCQYSDSFSVMTNEAEMDPIIAAGFHNLTCSRLCRLPEELLLDIMKRLDMTTIQCLRRTSRLFLRLYSSPVFCNSYLEHDDQRLQLEHHDHWHEPRRKRGDTWPGELQVLLDKDMAGYCEGCQKRRRLQSWMSKKTALTGKYLHCSGCNIDHPVCLFSKSQRSARPKSRICIGREGHLRMCEHQTITWDKIIRIGKPLAELDIEIPAIVNVCDCLDESHFPTHHTKDASLLSRHPTFPLLKISGCKQSVVFVTIVWYGHLCLPDIGFEEDGYNKIATPSQMCQELRQFRKGAAEFILPEFTPGHLIEMNCFDPNRCSCLRYAGPEQLPKGWKLAPDKVSDFLPYTTKKTTLIDMQHPACRSHPGHRLSALRAFEPDKQEGLQSEQKRIETHFISIPTPGDSSLVILEIVSCPAQSRCVQIRYNRVITVISKASRPSRVTWQWCQAMDPDSYNLTNDKESFEILWCRQPECKNYYKYLKKAPFRVKDMN